MIGIEPCRDDVQARSWNAHWLSWSALTKQPRPRNYNKAGSNIITKSRVGQNVTQIHCLILYFLQTSAAPAHLFVACIVVQLESCHDRNRRRSFPAAIACLLFHTKADEQTWLRASTSTTISSIRNRRHFTLAPAKWRFQAHPLANKASSVRARRLRAARARAMRHPARSICRVCSTMP